MKKKLKTKALAILMAVLMVATLIPATILNVFAITEGDYKYELINNNSEVRITKYVGIIGDVYIPETIAKKPVTEIGSNSFKGNALITYVWAGNNVVTIGDNAFQNCAALTNIDFGSGLKTINAYAFQNCDSLIKIVIPDSVDNLGNACIFEGCDKLKEVTIGNGVKIIKNSMFANCPMLEKVTLGSSVEEICNHAFYNCTALKEMKFPDSMVTIGESAFEDCTALTNIDFGNGLKTIDRFAFQNCDSLIKIVIPDSVEEFVETYGRSHIFNGCDKLKEVTIGNGIKTIGCFMFENCPMLEKVTLGSSVEEIKEHAFNSCTALKEIKFPDSMITIGKNAFEDCKALTNIDFGNGLKTIHSLAFQNCDSLIKIVIPDSVEKSGGYQIFAGCDKLKEAIIGNGIKIIEDSMFSNCPMLEKVTLGSGVEIIKERAFEGCIALKNIDFGNKLKTIGEYAFQNCNSLIKIVIPDSVENLGDYYIFEGCDKLKEVAIGNGVKTIKNSMFANCPMLEKVTLGSSVETIGYSAFYKCTALKDVYFLGNLPTIDADRNANFNNANWYRVNSSTGLDKASLSSTAKKVTINANGGIEATFTKDFDGGVITAPINPTREGYTFIGWYKNADGTGNEFNFSKDIQTTDTTLFAKWEINTYRIFFDPRGGQVTTGGKAVIYGQPVGALDVPVLAGDTFKGWYLGQNGAGPKYTKDTKMPAKDIYLFASWEKNSAATTVVLDTQGGNFLAPINAILNTTISKPALIPVKSGYDFIGWYKDADHNTKWNFATDKITANTTIYANWKKVAAEAPIPTPPTAVNGGTITENSVQISWNASDNATGYNVYVNGELKNDSPIADTSYVVANLSANTQYEITVKAVNEKGESATGASITVTTKVAAETPIPTPPTAVNGGTVTENSVQISWNASDNATGYNVYVNGELKNDSPIADTSYVVANLSANTQYEIIIKAVIGDVVSATGTSITVTTKETEKPDPIVPSERMLGDVNGDDKVTAADAILALRAEAKLKTLSPEEFTAADVTGDGKVTAADAIKILRFEAKLISAF